MAVVDGHGRLVTFNDRASTLKDKDNKEGCREINTKYNMFSL